MVEARARCAARNATIWTHCNCRRSQAGWTANCGLPNKISIGHAGVFGHAPMIAPAGPRVKPLDVGAFAARHTMTRAARPWMRSNVGGYFSGPRPQTPLPRACDRCFSTFLVEHQTERPSHPSYRCGWPTKRSRDLLRARFHLSPGFQALQFVLRPFLWWAGLHLLCL
jgi:hypothetical protein